MALDKRASLTVGLLGAALFWGSLDSRPACAEDRKVSAQELVKQGFFSDFDESDLTSLLEGGGEVTVEIASRRPEPVEQAAGLVDLVTAEDIRQHGYRTLNDVLRTIPGFDILTDNVGRDRTIVRGLPTSARGFSEGIVVLINGHRLNEELNGGATGSNFDLPVTAFHHIEVLRGPASALYGSGALGAVVNLVTDGSEKDREKNVFAASAGFGSFGQALLGVELSRKVNDIWFAGSAEFTNSSSPNVVIDADAQTSRDLVSGQPPISLAPGNADGNVHSIETLYRGAYKELTFLWRMKQEKSGGFVGASDTLGAQENQLNARQLLFDVRWDRKVRAGAFAVRAGLTQSRSDDLLELLPPGLLRETADGAIVQYPSIFLQTALASRRLGVEGTYARTFGFEHDFTAGVAVERESTYSLSAKANLNFDTFFPSNTFDEIAGAVPGAARNIVGFWVQDAWRAPAQIAVNAALRLDTVSEGLGAQLSPRLSLVRPLPHDLLARVVFARGYALPSFRDTTFNLPGYVASPDLEPSTITSGEASLTFHRDPLQLRGAFFLSGLRKPVGLVKAPSLTDPTPLVNGHGTNAHGLELEGRRAFGEPIFLRYALTSSHDAETGERAADVPTHMLTLGGTIVLSHGFDVTPQLEIRSSRERLPGDPRPPVVGYGILNLAVRRVSFSRKFEVRAIAQNLLDRDYEDPSPSYGVPGDYPRAGLSVFIDAKYRF